MSSEHKTSPSRDEIWLDAGQPVAFWLDTWWPLLVIVFGLIFLFTLISWKPGDRGANIPGVKAPAVANHL